MEKVHIRVTKLVMTAKHLSYKDRLTGIKLPMLKYRRTRGTVTEVSSARDCHLCRYQYAYSIPGLVELAGIPGIRDPKIAILDTSIFQNRSGKIWITVIKKRSMNTKLIYQNGQYKFD